MKFKQESLGSKSLKLESLYTWKPSHSYGERWVMRTRGDSERVMISPMVVGMEVGTVGMEAKSLHMFVTLTRVMTSTSGHALSRS